MRHVLLRAGLCGLILVASLSPVRGGGINDYDNLVFFTFSGAVQVPGTTLQAGTYRFRLADPAGNRMIVQVTSENGRKVYATCFTVASQLLERHSGSGEAEVTFYETPRGVPPAVKAWYYAGQSTGYEFVYHGEQARQLAGMSGTQPAAIAAVPTSAPATR